MTLQETPIPSQHVELQIGGMTCASCANRIERKLNKLDGVLATVNYATEKAKVTLDAETAARHRGPGRRGRERRLHRPRPAPRRQR